MTKLAFTLSKSASNVEENALVRKAAMTLIVGLKSSLLPSHEA